jgi:hypothetical protein
MEKKKENNKKSEKITSESGMSIALDRFFKMLPSFISVIVGFTSIAYIIGWIQAKSYFTEFNAEWIITELSNFDIITYSWLPLSQLLFFIYLGVTDIMESDKRYKMTFFIIRFGWIIIIALGIIELLMSKFFPNWYNDIIGASFLPLLFTLYAAASFELLLINLQNKDFKWELMNVKIIYIIVLFGFIFIPRNMGRDEAKKDKNIQHTRLGKVYVKDDNRENLRLLKSKGQLLYVVELDSNNISNNIQILDYTQIMKIE